MDDDASSSTSDAPADTAHPSPLPLILAGVVAVAVVLGVVVGLVLTSSGEGGGDEGGEVARLSLDELDQGAPAPLEGGDPPPTGVPAPTTPFQTWDGTETTLAEYTGRPLVVNFFASWCAPCVQEMPAFEAVSQAYRDEVGFLGVAFQDSEGRSQEIVDATGVTYPLARDASGSLLRAFEGINMPTTVFLDADGNVVRVHTGALDEASLTEAIEQDLLP